MANDSPASSQPLHLESGSGSPPAAHTTLPQALELADLECAPRRVDALLGVVLASPDRVAVNVAARIHLARIAWLFFFVAALLGIPYGLSLGLPFWWRISTLYLGATLICLPSLHVFGCYLGLHLSAAQTFVLGLSIPAVAAVFSLGFAPILAFLRATIAQSEEVSTLAVLSLLLLVVSLIAGIVQLWRCGAGLRHAVPACTFALVVGWHFVFLYVVWRMARVLELLP